MSGTDDATRVTTTTETTVDPHSDEDHDGIISEPEKPVANILWVCAVVTLCAGVWALIGALVLLAFRPKDPTGSVDPAILVAVLGNVLTALGVHFTRQQRR